MTEARIAEAASVSKFITAGNATFTIVSSKTGARFTYKVVAPKDDKDGTLQFVKVLAGPDNEAHYRYIGILTNGRFRTTKKSKLPADATSVKAIEWLANRALPAGNISAIEFYHAGKCGRCGRTLTVPESITSGLGPICASAV